MRIGKAIKIALASKDMTSLALADKMGISINTIRKINDNSNPKMSTLIRIAHSLEIKLSDLIKLGE